MVLHAAAAPTPRLSGGHCLQLNGQPRLVFDEPIAAGAQPLHAHGDALPRRKLVDRAEEIQIGADGVTIDADNDIAQNRLAARAAVRAAQTGFGRARAGGDVEDKYATRHAKRSRLRRWDVTYAERGPLHLAVCDQSTHLMWRRGGEGEGTKGGEGEGWWRWSGARGGVVRGAREECSESTPAL